MGTKCIPSYADIFMGIFEEKYINPSNNNMKLLYLKFIDHIFLIWTRTLEELIKYKEQVNTIHPAIKFDFNFFFFFYKALTFLILLFIEP